MVTKVFVNGDSHTAQVYGEPAPTATEILAQEFGCDYENIALPGCSNQRIIRTTQERLRDLDPSHTLIIIGWTSFERTEWFYSGRWHAICGDPYYEVDAQLGHLWQDHISRYDSTSAQERGRQHLEQHHAIYVFHNLLKDLGYQFIFYQGCRYHFFANTAQESQPWRLEWQPDVWAHDPYHWIENGQIKADSFSYHALSHGCAHADERAHFGADAHRAWADRLRPMVQNKLSLLKGI